MASGLLSLKWNNHRSTFFHILSTVRTKEVYCDVTLACDGKFYPVHKLVLSTCSEYFEQIFERTQCKHPVVVLKDIKDDDLEALLNYMYIGEVNVLQDKLAGLIKAAECLRIKGLAVPDEAPVKEPISNKENKRNVHRIEESPQPKRRRRDDSVDSSSLERIVKISKPSREQSYSSPREQPYSEASSSTSHLNKLSSSGNVSRVDSQSRLSATEADDTDRGGSDNGDSNNQNEPENDTPQSSSSSNRPAVPEVILDESGVKSEPTEIEDDEVPDSKEALQSDLGYGGLADDDGGGEGSSGYTDSQLLSGTSQTVEDVVAQALPGSSGFQGNSFSLWEGEGSMQGFPVEGFSGDNNQARQMVEEGGKSGMWLGIGKLNHAIRCGVASISDVGSVIQRQHDNGLPTEKVNAAGSSENDKPFGCPYCPYRSDRRYNLRGHIYRLHQVL